jgi:uncharacterized damage-inducible protein DinB
MRQVEKLALQLTRSVDGEAWHGVSLTELLADVTAGQAAARPLSDSHSIWEIVHHVSAWLTFVRRRLQGELVVEVTPDEDWPPVLATGVEAWDRTRHRLVTENSRLGTAILELDDRQLGDVVRGQQSTFYEMLVGLPQHAAYHGGQILMLLRMVKTTESEVT